MARATAIGGRTAGAARFRPPDGCDSILITRPENVRYLSGFTGSSACLLVTRRQRLLFTDFRYRQQAEHEAAGYGIRIGTGAPASAAAAYAVKRRMNLGLLGVEGAHLSHELYRSLKRNLKGVRFRDAGGTVEALRAVKSRRETDYITDAARMADAALERLKRARIIGRTESEVAWMLERWLRENGSEALPFAIIVASGPRSALPHGVASKRVIGRDELVVIDLGARVAGYCSDITRTYATGTLSRRQQRIYEVVREAQGQAVAALAPGVDCAAVDAVARDMIDEAGYGAEFGHALGHGVGLEAHEKPVLAARSKDRLAAGMVVTVEPGIYRVRVGGVRIEDTVDITVTGPVSLTSAPRELVRLR